MRSFVTGCHCFVAALICTAVPPLTMLAAAPLSDKEKPPAETQAEKNRKALEQTVSVDVSEQPLQGVLAKLAEQTKLKIVLDKATLVQSGIVDPESPVTAKLTDAPLRTVLRSILGQYNLSHVLVDDTLLVTTEEMALYRQMRQRVSAEFDEVALGTALKQLSRQTATNLVLDPRVPKEAKTAGLTLRLEDVPLETAVRLMAEMASLKSVRLGNVLFVTTEARADKLRSEPESGPPATNGADVPAVREVIPIPMRRIAPPPPPAAAPAPAAPAPAAPPAIR